jgi:CDP-diglyceride synthetase
MIRANAYSTTGGTLILMLYYWVTSDNTAAWSYSIRWIVPLLPLLFFFLYPYFEVLNKRRETVFQALLCVSVVIATVGALNPWSPLPYSQISFVANIKQFVAHLHRPPPLPPKS